MKYATIVIVLVFAMPAIADEFNGNSYSLEQMQIDNQRVQIEEQQRQLYDLERQQERMRQGMQTPGIYVYPSVPQYPVNPSRPR